MTDGKNLQDLKEQIDINPKDNVMETKEMEDFLESPDNMEKLGKALEEDINPELLQEFKNAIEGICSEIINSSKKKREMLELPLNKYRILLFYHKNFEPKDEINQPKKKEKTIYDNVSDYLIKLLKICIDEDNTIKGPIAKEMEREQKERQDKQFKLLEEKYKIDPSERVMQMLLENIEKCNAAALDKWNNEKGEIDTILKKEGILTGADAEKLLYFRDYYYEAGSIRYINYNINPEIKPLLREETGCLRYIIPEYDEIAKAIDERISTNNDLLQITEDIYKALMEEYSDPLKNLKSLGINTSLKPNWDALQKDIKTVEDVDKINENTIAKYINIKGVPKENYIYIANNFKAIIKRHLEINPGYNSILGGKAIDMSFDKIVNNNKHIINLYSNVENLIKNNEDKQINTIAGKLNKGDQDSLQFVDLWLNMYLGNKKEKEQNKILEKIFDKFPSTDAEKFFNACNKDKALGSLKDRYIFYWLFKEEALLSLKDNKGKNIYLLDFSKKNKFENFVGKGGKLSDELDLDKIYEYTQNYYHGSEGVDKLKIDESIPLKDILIFMSFLREKLEENTNLSKIASEKIRKDRDMVDNNPFLGYGGHVTANNAGFNEEKKIKNNCITIEEKYAALLLKSKNRPKGKIQGISGSNLTLDFSKGNNPKDIVRDSFGEKLSDSWNEFKYNFKHDKKAFWGGLAGMIAGIGASTLSCVSGNIWAAAGAFTLTSRVVNGAVQEALNGLQYIYELNPGHKKATGGNQVNEFGDSFMKGFGAYEAVVDKNGQPILDKNGKIQYQFIGWDRFGSNLGFDYLSGVAMFGAFKALGPTFSDIKGIKIPKNIPVIGGFPAGVPLEFTSKWLFVQNFGIDMPMNALHTGVDVFFNVGEPHQRHHHRNPIYREIKGEYPEESEYYESKNIGDAFDAMLGNVEEHLTIENQSQVFFNTLLYCGMLEAGQGIAGKIKSYMPKARIAEYETSNRKFQEAQREFVSKIKEKGLTLNEKFELTYAKNGAKVKDIRLLMQFKPGLIKLKGVLAEHTKATQELIASEKELSGDGSKTYGLLKKMRLLSDKQPPLKILKDEINKLKKQYDEALRQGNVDQAGKYEILINEYLSTQVLLLTHVHPEAHVNIGLGDAARIEKAENLLKAQKLLGEEGLSNAQKEAILQAHEAPGDAYSLSSEELMNKCRILIKAGLTMDQVRILMDNCICGKMKGTGEGGEVRDETTGADRTETPRVEADRAETTGADRTETPRVDPKVDAGRTELTQFKEGFENIFQQQGPEAAAEWFKTNYLEVFEAKKLSVWKEKFDKIKQELRENGDRENFEKKFKELMDDFNRDLLETKSFLKEIKNAFKNRAKERGEDYKETYEDFYEDNFEKKALEYYKGTGGDKKLKNEKKYKESSYEVYHEADIYFGGRFAEIARLYKEYTNRYKREYDSLLENGEINKARDMEQFLKRQYELLIEYGPDNLDGLIDFKGAKKRIKGQLGRELYDGLQSIYEKLEDGAITEAEIAEKIQELSNNIDFPGDVAESLGLDRGMKRNAERLKQAMSRINHYLTEYYELISYVFDPKVENMLMQDAIGAALEHGHYVEKNGKTRKYSTESEEHREKRINEEKQRRERASQNGNVIGELMEYLNNVGKAKEETQTNETKKTRKPITEGEKHQIGTEIEGLAKGLKELGFTNAEIYDLCKTCLDSMLYQTMESQTRTMGDHGINHIAGNISRFDGYLDSWIKAGKSLGNGIRNENVGKLMGHIIQIIHDFGYAARVSKGSTHFDGSAFHPTTSQMFFDEIVKPLLEKRFSPEEIDTMSSAIGSHDGTTLDWNNPIVTMTHIADNMAIGVDKFQQLMTHQKIVPYLSTLARWKGDLDAGKKYIIEEIDKDKSISESEREALKSAINEFNDRSFDNFGFFSIEGANNLVIGKDGIQTLEYYETQYQGVSGLELEAKIRGLNYEKIQNTIAEARRTGDITKLYELLNGEFEKWGDQITKPRGDYGERYNVEVNGKIIAEKGKVDTNLVKAYLLVGIPIEFTTNGGNVALRADFIRSVDRKSGNYDNAYKINEAAKTIDTIQERYFNESQTLDIGTIEKHANYITQDIKTLKTLLESGKLPESSNITDLQADIEGLETYTSTLIDENIKEQITKIIDELKTINNGKSLSLEDIESMESTLNGLLPVLLSITATTSSGQ